MTVSFILIGLFVISNLFVPIVVETAAEHFEGQTIILKNGTMVQNVTSATIRTDYYGWTDNVALSFKVILIVWLAAVCIDVALSNKRPKHKKQKGEPHEERVY